MWPTQRRRADGCVRAADYRLAAALKLTLFAFIPMLIGGCGGGGEKGATRPTASDFETHEYFASGGLDRIRASAAYAEGATGSNVTVAVIGSGEVDITHPELEGQVTSTWGFHPDTGHIVRTQGDSWFSHSGTAIAGLISARKNDRLLHGVAYNARMHNIDTFGSVDGTDAATIARQAQSNTASALNFTSADIVYVSVPTSEPIGDPLRNTLASTLTARPNRLVVTEAGDDGADNPRPLGQLAADPAMKGQLVVAGSVDAENRISSFSNRAGNAADFFVVAPGEGLTSLAPTQQVALPLFGCCWPQCPACTSKLAGRTDYAAALVTGAAAVLRQQFPFLTGSEIAGLLFATSTDLGDPGVDAVYGHGLVNLDAAMRPVGKLSIPTGSTVTGSSSSLDVTSLSLAPAFGDAGLPSAVLDQVIVLDAYQRPYRVPLSTRVGVRRRDVPLEALLDWSSSQLAVTPQPLQGTTFAFVASRGGLARLVEELDSGSVVTPLREDTYLHLGWDVPPASHFALDHTAFDDDMFLRLHDTRMPQLDLMGEARGAALSHRMRSGTTLTLGWFEGEGTSGADGERYRLTQALMRRDFGSAFGLALGLGLLSERDTFLGSRSNGAFGSGVGADSQFASLLGTYRIGARTTLEASYVRVRTDVQPRGISLLSDWSLIQADALSLALLRGDLWTAGDRAGVRLSQPLRVREAEATLSVPVGRDLSGNVMHHAQRAELTPRGREVNLELAYERPVSRRGKFSSHLLLRHEPGHVADENFDVAIGIRGSLAF